MELMLELSGLTRQEGLVVRGGATSKDFKGVAKVLVKRSQSWTGRAPTSTLHGKSSGKGPGNWEVHIFFCKGFVSTFSLHRLPRWGGRWWEQHWDEHWHDEQTWNEDESYASLLGGIEDEPQATVVRMTMTTSMMLMSTKQWHWTVWWMSKMQTRSKLVMRFNCNWQLMQLLAKPRARASFAKKANLARASWFALILPWMALQQFAGCADLHCRRRLIPCWWQTQRSDRRVEGPDAEPTEVGRGFKDVHTTSCFHRLSKSCRSPGGRDSGSRARQAAWHWADRHSWQFVAWRSEKT